MGNTNSQARGFTVARGGAPVEDDPFAELAEIFESELRFDPRLDDGGQQRHAARVDAARREPSFDGDAVDREFEAAFENDLASSRQSQARPGASVPRYETRVNGRATARNAGRPEAPARRPAQSRPVHLTDEEIDGELDEVLRSLSDPARPRGRIVVETQSFAPERAEEERLPSPPSDVDEFEELIRSELAVIRPAVATAPRRAERQVAPQFPAEDEYEPAAERPPVATRGSLRRVLTMGASAAALVLVAGVGVGVWHSSSALPGIGGEPLLIKADATPFKVVPKDPGGRAYPNQNKAVYDRVGAPAKAADASPTQHALLKNAEEPMELPKEEERSYDDLPGVEIGDTADATKDETRVTEATETAEASAEPVLQPRKVRTLSVGADGKLIEAEAPVAAPKPAAHAQASHVAAPKPAAAPQAADPMQVAALAPIRPAAPIVEAAAPPASVAPTAAEALPAPVASAMPSGGYFVQVASQPTEAGAQQSLRSFGSRYGSVVGGRPVGIQSGEVAGKGTYWRVRVAASSKDEANSVCSKLKSAGASCFVTR